MAAVGELGTQEDLRAREVQEVQEGQEGQEAQAAQGDLVVCPGNGQTGQTAHPAPPTSTFGSLGLYT